MAYDEDLANRIREQLAAEDALRQPHARPFDMSARPMRAWVLVAPEGVRTDAELAGWVARGVSFARSLPPKG